MLFFAFFLLGQILFNYGNNYSCNNMLQYLVIHNSILL